MASGALSPTVTAVKDGEPKSVKEFSELIKYLQQAHKDLMRWRGIIAKHPPNHPPKFGNITIRKSDINRYSQAFLTQLGDLKKIYATRKKKSVRSGGQLNSLFYVSDQLVDFYKSSNLGPADPDQPRKGKLSKEIELLTKHHMSTSGILTSLISRYIESNSLKSDSNPGRFIPDKHMKESFSDTHYILFDENLSKRDFSPGTTQDRKDKISEHIKNGKKNAFQRVEGRTDKRSGEEVYDKKKGLLYTTMMVFNNFYRVPASLLSEEERSKLNDPEFVEQAKELQGKLTKITSWHHQK